MYLQGILNKEQALVKIGSDDFIDKTQDSHTPSTIFTSDKSQVFSPKSKLDLKKSQSSFQLYKTLESERYSNHTPRRGNGMVYALFINYSLLYLL